MESATQTASGSKAGLWAGRIISGLVVLFMLFNGVVGLMQPPQAVQGMVHLGYPQHLGIPIAVIMLVCTIIYAIPQTAFLGALLLTAYYGGAIASHVRVGEPFYFPIHLRRAGMGRAFPARRPSAYAYSTAELT